MFRTNTGNGQAKLSILARLLLGVAGLVVVAAPGWAQVEYTLTLNHPGGLMTVEVEEPVTLRWTEEDVRKFWQRPAAHFQLRTAIAAPTGGDPTEVGDENRRVCSDLLVPVNDLYSFSSKIEFSIDQTNALLPGLYVDIHNLGDAAAPVDDWEADMANFWPIPLTATTREIWGVARIPLEAAEEEEEEEAEGAGVAQTGGLLAALSGRAKVDPLTGLGVWPSAGNQWRGSAAGQVQTAQTDSGLWLDVEHRFKLIHDLLMVELIITNKDDRSHYVGTRLFFDGSFGGPTYFDGQPFILPTGQTITNECILPDAETDLPEYWVAIGDPEPIAVRGLVKSSEVNSRGNATFSAGPPDSLEFGEWSRLTRAWFDFLPNPNQNLVGMDWAYAVKWDEQRLEPGQSRRYVTFYGLGAATADYEPFVSAAGYGPRVLQEQRGDDPATDDIEDADHYYLSDEKGRSPFPVDFYVDNFGGQPVFNAQAAIDLPDGFELCPEGQSLVKSLGQINPNDLKSVGWTVRAVNPRPGLAVIKMSSVGKLIRHKVFVPALPILPPRPSLTGLEMLSIPFTFDNTDAQHVFDSLGDLTGGGPDDPRLIRYEPSAWQYRTFPHAFLTNVVPGEGYWVYNPNEETLVLPADAEEVSTDDAYIVHLDKYWNQIGSPFGVPIQLSQAQVLRTSTQQVFDIEAAIDRNLFQPVLFSYDPSINDYEWETDLYAIRLDPFEGYWILAREDISLIFPPPLVVAPVQAVPAASEASEADGWQVELVVSGASRVCQGRALGVSSVAQEGLDKTDVPSPPAALAQGPVLRADFISPAQQAPACVVDMRPADLSEYTWLLAVTTDAQNEPITVTWPSLAALPPDMIAILEDVASGQKRFMRTTTSYTYNSGDGGVRTLKVTVAMADQVTPVVSDVTAAAAPAGNWAISYTLSGAALVEARIRNISGVVIKHLSSGEVSTAGRNVMLWNGHSDRGTAVPNGRYLVEIEARSPDTGQTGRVISTFAVTR